MKNRLALLLTILLMMSGLWTFAQVAPEPQPQPQPQPQVLPQPQPAPAIAPVPPADVVGEIRIDEAVEIQRGQAQYQRGIAQQAGQAQYERAVAQQAAQDARVVWAYKQKTEKGSYIGLGTSPIPTVLRDQLKLPNGSGLVVDRVEPNSPAEVAGMKVSDIIQKLDEQVLINPHQFGVLVRNLKPDVEVKLSIIRQTQPQTVSIKPVEKDLAPLDEAAAYGGVAAWRDNQLANTTRYGGGGGAYTITTTPRKTNNGAANLFTADDHTEMVTDNGKTKIITTIGNKGERRACVIDKATGNVLFDGAIETDAQREALPKEVQDQLKQLDQMKLTAPIGARAVPTPRAFVFTDKTALKLGNAPRNNLPKPKSVSGSDDDYTWEFTTKTDENGKPELELLLLDKNGKILFQGPFSRSRDTQTLPAPVAERFKTEPWYSMIDDLKNAGGANGVMNIKGGGIGAGGPAGAAPAGGADFAPKPKEKAK